MTAPRRIVPLIVLIALAATGLDGAGRQTPSSATNTGRVSGIVFAADTGQPIQGATVRLTGRALQRVVAADDNGAFELDRVPPGDYLLAAVMQGYAVGTFGQRTASDAPRSFELGAGQTRQADIPLTPLGRISGHLVDETGLPARGVSVQAVRRPRDEAQERASDAKGAVTGEDGAFTIAGLPPGDYFVLARSAPAPSDAVPPSGSPMPPLFRQAAFTYYPGTTAPSEASPVRVDRGMGSASISFAMQPSRLSRISGVVLSSSGLPDTSAVVLVSRAPSGVPVLANFPAFSEVDREGRFSVSDLPAGRYSLDVRSRAGFEALAVTGGSVTNVRDESPEFASAILQLAGEDVDDMVVTTHSGFTLSGRLVVKGTMPAQAMRSIRISATPVGAGAPFSRMTRRDTATVGADGAFELDKLSGLQAIQVSGLPATWGLERVGLGPLDVTDEGLNMAFDVTGVEVVVARQGELLGRVLEVRSVPVPGATVLLFPVDRRHWTTTRLIRSILSTPDGTFAFTGLPAGEYYATALPAIVEGVQVEPDDLEPLASRATKLSVAGGGQQTLNLRIQ